MTAATTLDPGRTFTFCRDLWERDLQARLEDFIRIPAISPAYDPDWDGRGDLDRVADELARWIHSLPIPGSHVEVLRAPGRTPLVFVDIPGTQVADGTVLFYGHLDKQPGGAGWSEGLGPWTPVFDGTRLFGRGGADDGYAPYASMAAVLAVDEQQGRRPRCLGIFETSEESGSPDLDHWLGLLGPRIGPVELVACLDSGAGDYDRLWLVTSLRGHCGGRLEVQVLDEGAHSGDAGGIVPSSFRLLRRLLDRLEDSATGRILVPEANVVIPPERIAQAKQASEVLGNRILERFAWYGSGETRAEAMNADLAELLLNRAWRPSLSITGADGIPSIADAGNVLRPSTGVKLSLRLPPSADSAATARAVQRTLEADPPANARVRFDPDGVIVDGWSAAPMAPWLARTLMSASRDFFDGRDLAMIGQGGSIPLMGILDRHFPQAQVLAGGVQGPGTNAHGPNEALHMPYTHRLTACLATLLPAVAGNPAVPRS